MQVSNSMRALSRAAVLGALLYVWNAATSQPCSAWQDAGHDAYVDDDDDGNTVHVHGNPCDQCGGRPGFLRKIFSHLPFHGCGDCGLGCCHLSLHRTSAEADESQDEEPDEQEFPRFHPIPIRPVFAPRDEHGMPIPPVPDPSLIEMPDYDPGAAPQREELAPPEPLNEQSDHPSSAAKARTHQASWVFQQPTKPRIQISSRNPRPQFEIQDHPRKTTRKKR